MCGSTHGKISKTPKTKESIRIVDTKIASTQVLIKKVMGYKGNWDFK